MELANLMIINNMKEVSRFLSIYSSNQSDRRNAIKQLSVRNIFDLDKIDISGVDNRTKVIFDIFMKNIGLEIVKTDDIKEDV